MGAGELRPHLQSESAGINGRVGQNYRPPTLDFCGKPHGSPIICSNPQGPPLPWQPAVSLIRDKKVGAASSDTGSPGVPPVGERWQQDVGLTLTSSSPLLLLFLLSGLLVALLLATLSRLLLLLTRLLVLLATLALLATLVWIAHVFPRLVSVYAVVNRRPNTLVPFFGRNYRCRSGQRPPRTTDCKWRRVGKHHSGKKGCQPRVAAPTIWLT